jgi:hypothetical protein
MHDFDADDNGSMAAMCSRITSIEELASTCVGAGARIVLHRHVRRSQVTGTRR